MACIWNARWGGACVVRLAPDGTTLAVIDLPVKLPTSCCFVGSSLFVTTSTWEFSGADFAEQPLAGHLLRIEAGVVGHPFVPFATRHQ